MSSTGETITLSTSDDPPVLIKVSRAALATQSKVFADMLSLPLESDSKDPSIPLEEQEADIKTFLLMLEARETEENLAALTESQWRTIAALSAKYDSWSVRKAVEAKAWQLEAEGGSAAFAFTLATLTGNHELIKCTAKRAVLIPDLQSSSFFVSRGWKDGLAAWRTAQASRCLFELQSQSTVPKGGCTCGSLSWRTQWRKLLFHSIATFDICSIPSIKLDQSLYEDIDCHDSCRQQFEVCALDLKKDFQRG